ncbi:hypothetical protein C8J42_103626 [Sphingomonas sp. PP-CE-1A-559]|nr:hypothetical protein C8J42_103626 [Sphingomonas sp. PP-CE-1A-559]
MPWTGSLAAKPSPDPSHKREGSSQKLASS